MITIIYLKFIFAFYFLSDAQVVAPSIHTIDLHSQDRRHSYFYVFEYQSKYGDFPQVS